MSSTSLTSGDNESGLSARELRYRRRAELKEQEEQKTALRRELENQFTEEDLESALSQQDGTSKIIVAVMESPFSGFILRNLAYAERAMEFLRQKGWTVIVPHLTWTQHSQCKEYFVSDYDPKWDLPNCGREESLKQIWELRRRADYVVMFEDYGISSGMNDAVHQKMEEPEAFHLLRMKLGDLHLDEENAYRRMSCWQRVQYRLGYGPGSK